MQPRYGVYCVRSKSWFGLVLRPGFLFCVPCCTSLAVYVLVQDKRSSQARALGSSATFIFCFVCSVYFELASTRLSSMITVVLVSLVFTLRVCLLVS